MKHFTEQAVVFTSVSKWLFLSALIGVLCSSFIVLFLKILHFSENSRTLLGFPYYYTLPFALVLTVWIVKKIAPKASGHGTEKVIEAVHQNNGEINWKIIPIKTLVTVLTIFSGGSVGKEGPGAQIGAGVSSLFSNIFKFSNQDKKKLVICGISAGFATVFGTPIAGAIFGVEVLIVGSLMYDVLLASIVSGLSAYTVAGLWGIEYPLTKVVNFMLPHFDIHIGFWVIIGAIFFGYVSDLIITVIEKIQEYFKKLKIHYLLIPFLGGVSIVILTLFVGEKYLGLGMESIWDALSPDQSLSESINWYDAALKLLFTSISLGSGGSGGVITPIFFMGSTIGNFFGSLIGDHVAFFAALGLVSVLAGTTNAPIASILMAGELFGMEILHYAALSCIISFLITGHRSIFPSQILAIKKGEYLDIELGHSIDETTATYTGGLEPKTFKDIKKRIEYKRILRQRKNRRINSKNQKKLD